ncbi:OmpA family protein [Rhodovulum kholense]|uniref:OOP family OmpA-OmpF porin n=1 Tax=Rhodovulum kholense TaxID=453584 RepID=A0A8E3AQZ7_9RHOB|nr:OmpA family protein [Rhodovulum kholense]PTW50392.1 OOP family OmpA-OmpF porin [Rhodovulum kholense]
MTPPAPLARVPALLPVLAPALVLALWPGRAPAEVPALPETATVAADETEAESSLRLPTAPYDGQTVPTLRAEGAIRRLVWQAPLDGQGTLQVIDGLKAQLIAGGYRIAFQCAAAGCGGFDFRFATDTLPEPAMHVDLGDFRYLLAEKVRPDGTDYVSLMVSRSEERAFVQVTRVGRPEAPAPVQSTKSPDPAALPLIDAPAGPATEGTLADRLDRDGRAVLAGVDFATGASNLDGGPFPALDTLADYLRAHPGARIVLVGHTDTEGGLAGNIALSKKRAEAVRSYLVATLGVPADRVAAEGVGFLAPLASNATDSGRRENRRVEAVLDTAQ